MKKTILPLFAMVMLLASGCGLGKVKRLQNCEFRTTTLENTSLAGVNVQAINSLFSIKLGDMLKLADAVKSGSLPLTFVLNTEVRNPNKKPASMTKVDWIASIDDDEIAHGAVEQRVEIPGMGTATVPFTVGTDVMQLLRGKSKDALITYALGLAGANNAPVRVSIKLKPYIHIGKKEIAYPGFIRLSQEFSAS